MEVLDVSNIKLLLSFPLEIGNVVGNILEEDDKGWRNWLKLVYAVPEIVELLKVDWSKIKEEYLNLDDAERAEIKEFMKNKFDLKDDRVEALIEDSFSILFNIESITRESMKLFKSI